MGAIDHEVNDIFRNKSTNRYFFIQEEINCVDTETLIASSTSPIKPPTLAITSSAYPMIPPTSSITSPTSSITSQTSSIKSSTPTLTAHWTPTYAPCTSKTELSVNYTVKDGKSTDAISTSTTLLTTTVLNETIKNQTIIWSPATTEETTQPHIKLHRLSTIVNLKFKLQYYTCM